MQVAQVGGPDGFTHLLAQLFAGVSTEGAGHLEDDKRRQRIAVLKAVLPRVLDEAESQLIPALRRAVAQAAPPQPDFLIRLASQVQLSADDQARLSVALSASDDPSCRGQGAQRIPLPLPASGRAYLV